MIRIVVPVTFLLLVFIGYCIWVVRMVHRENSDRKDRRRKEDQQWTEDMLRDD